MNKHLTLRIHELENQFKLISEQIFVLKEEKIITVETLMKFKIKKDLDRLEEERNRIVSELAYYVKINNYFKVVQLEIDTKLDILKKRLLMEKTIALKSLALQKEEENNRLETAHIINHQNFLVKRKDELFQVMLKFGQQTSKRLKELKALDLEATLKEKLYRDFLQIWQDTQEEMKKSLDDYLAILEQKIKK